MAMLQVSPAGQPAAEAQSGVDPIAQVASQVVATVPATPAPPARQQSWPLAQLSSLEH
jgi:hypothetical protein